MLDIDEQLAREKYFTTSNMNLCGYLVAHNFKYVQMKKYDRSVIFYFEKSKELENCTKDFFEDKELKKYFDCIRSIRSEARLID